MSSTPCATLVATDGRTLPLVATALAVRAAGGLAHVVLSQQFANPYAEPLHVTYQVPLPADGAVSGYRFVLGDREVVGEIDRRDRARERFEQAVLDGHTAALLDQERSGLFTQQLGNLPPGAAVVVELRIDQPLVWMNERDGAWEWRFPTVVAPRYLGGPGRVEDAARIATHTTLDRLPVTVALELAIEERHGALESPSHTVRSETRGGRTQVALADADATLDRDVVIRWAVAGTHAASTAHRARPAADHPLGDDAFALLTVVPPGPAHAGAHVPRDLIVLLDTSGSMSGAPLAQAKRLAAALVDGLDARDRLELVEFSSAVRAWQRGPVAAEPAMRAAAKQWLAGLSAQGGTEMRTGIRAALASLRAEAQRQIVLVTDGQIGFESEIVAEIHQSLPAGCRVHTIGVGAAVNRSLTMPAARAGRGLEIVLGVDEDPERAIARLCAHTGAPLVVDLAIDGDALLEHAPVHLPDLMAGHPATIAVRVRASGGLLRVRGRTATGAWEQRLQLPPTSAGEGNPAVVTRFGRELVEDLELRIAAGEPQRAIDPILAQVGLHYRIATRLTSWVAIDAVISVDPTAPVRREHMPHALPFGMSAEGVGLRAPQPAMALGGAPMQAASMPMGAPAPAKRKGMIGTMVDALRGRATPGAPGAPPPAPARPAPPVPARAESRERAPEAIASPAADGADTDEFGGRFNEGFAETLADEKPEGASVTRAGAIRPLELHGTFTRLADGSLVIEVELSTALPWQVPASIALHADDGTVTVVEIDPTRSTRDGLLASGQRARLVCRSAPPGTLVLAVIDGLVPMLVRP